MRTEKNKKRFSRRPSLAREWDETMRPRYYSSIALFQSFAGEWKYTTGPDLSF
jgi:hypothetical protein